jgi:methyl-accepting chemotaxis protein
MKLQSLNSAIRFLSKNKIVKKYFNNLKISQKLALSSFAFVFPLIILLYFTISESNKNINFTEKELIGTEFISSVHKIIHNLYVHQLYSNYYISGYKSKEEQIKKIELLVDKSILELKTLYETEGSNINLNNEYFKSRKIEYLKPSSLNDQWTEIKSEWKTYFSEINNTKHEELIDNVHSFLDDAVDKSNLILDGDLDTYYMMKISTEVLPNVYYDIADISKTCQSVYKIKKNKEDPNFFVSYSIPKLEDESQMGLSMVDVVLIEDENYYGTSESLQNTIPLVLEEYDKDIFTYYEAASQLNKKNALSPDDFFQLNLRTYSTLSKYWKTITNELQTLLDIRISSLASKRFWSLVLSFTMLFFAIGFVVLTVTQITKSLHKVSQMAGEIASGNFHRAISNLRQSSSDDLYTEKLERKLFKNELMQLYSDILMMSSKLNLLLNQVRHSGIKVSSSSTQMTASVKQLEVTLAEQLASTSEVNSTSKVIANSADVLALNMNKVKSLAKETTQLSHSGLESLNEIKTTSELLLNSVNDISEKLNIINFKTKNITEVISTITKVANQTNLLSLNAAIEAEKAGSFGVGFSVVAREIRRLADQTAIAAMDIEEMIAEMQTAVHDGVVRVQSYSKESIGSFNKIQTTITDLTKIISHIQDLGPEFDKLNEGMQSQAISASQISEAMDQLKTASLNTRDSLIELNDVNKELNFAVSNLQQGVSKFSTSNE